PGHGAGTGAGGSGARSHVDVPRVDRDVELAVRVDLDVAVARGAAHDAATGQGDDEAIRGGVDELRRRSELAQAPLDDDRDAVRERGGVGEVVGDQQRRDAQAA